MLKQLYCSKILLLAAFLVLASCAREKAPATPLETFKTYTKAIKQKDTATMKLLLSAETLRMHELEAQAQSLTVDDIVKRETLFSENQTSVKLRDEKIEGDSATLEVENSFGVWETVPFHMEDGQWKIDKKGYAQRMMQEMDRDRQQLDDIINQSRQP